MEAQRIEIGEHHEVSQKVETVRTRWAALKKEKPSKQSRPVSIIQDEPEAVPVILNQTPVELPPPQTENGVGDASMPHTPVKPPAIKSEAQKKLEQSVDSVNHWERQESVLIFVYVRTFLFLTPRCKAATISLQTTFKPYLYRLGNKKFSSFFVKLIKFDSLSD